MVCGSSFSRSRTQFELSSGPSFPSSPPLSAVCRFLFFAAGVITSSENSGMLFESPLIICRNNLTVQQGPSIPPLLSPSSAGFSLYSVIVNRTAFSIFPHPFLLLGIRMVGGFRSDRLRESSADTLDQWISRVDRLAPRSVCRRWDRIRRENVSCMRTVFLICNVINREICSRLNREFTREKNRV